MTESAATEDTGILEQLDPDRGRACNLLIPHPFDSSAPRHRCGRPAAYAVELNNKPCGHKTVIYLCASCWDYKVRTHTPIRHSPEGGSCGVNYYLPDAVTAWRRL